MSNANILAFDKSARRVDIDGRLHLDHSNISKAAINPYYGQEIPGWEVLGLQADKIYNLLRDPEELEKAAPTFARLPILSKHVPVSVNSLDDEQKKLIIGTIGSDIAFEIPYLVADLSFWDASAIAGIETEQVTELSCGYRYIPVMEPGEFEGQSYDGRMTNIVGNHLALVEFGRAGSDVVVADSKPVIKETPAMKTTKLGKALLAALCAASPVLAQDQSMPALVGAATRKTFNKADVSAKCVALDAEIDPQTLDNLLDSILDVERDPTPVTNPAAVGDVDEPAVESKADKLRKMLAGKVDDETLNSILGIVGDEEKPEEKPVDMKGAMDSFRNQLREADEARREVRPVVGDVYALDSAAEIYGFALDHMKIEHKDITDAKALRGMFKVAHEAAASKPIKNSVTMDGGDMSKRFPNANRFQIA